MRKKEKKRQDIEYKIKHDALLNLVVSYYHNELKLRGDRILNKEYCNYFGITNLNA